MGQGGEWLVIFQVFTPETNFEGLIWKQDSSALGQRVCGLLKDTGEIGLKRHQDSFAWGSLPFGLLYPHQCVIVVSDEKRENWTGSSTWGHNGWEFSNVAKNIKLQIQELLWITSRINYQENQTWAYHNTIANIHTNQSLSIKFDTCIYPCSQHPEYNREHFYYSRNFLHAAFQSIPTPRGNHCSISITID